MSWNTVEIEITSAERSKVLLWRLPLLMSWLDLHDYFKYLDTRLLCGHVPDPFPRCGIESGHATPGTRLARALLPGIPRIILWFELTIINESEAYSSKN